MLYFDTPAKTAPAKLSVQLYSCFFRVLSPLKTFISGLVAIFAFLQQFNCYAGAGLGIGQRVMVVLKAIATGGGYSLELVVGQITQLAAGGADFKSII